MKKEILPSFLVTFLDPTPTLVTLSVDYTTSDIVISLAHSALVETSNNIGETLKTFQ
jgi:hypothetical protein